MYTGTSAAFNAAIQTDHNVAVKVEVWTPSSLAPVLTIEWLNNEQPPWALQPSAILTDGAVTYDKQSDQRSSFTMTIVSPDGTLIPRKATDAFTPWGNEVRLFRGVFWPITGAKEYVPLGRFRISTVDINDEKGVPTMTITGADRSLNISRNVVPFYWPDINTQKLILGNSWAHMIQVMCSDRWPYVQFDTTKGGIGPTSSASYNTGWTSYQNDPVNGMIPNFLSSFGEGTDLWSQLLRLNSIRCFVSRCH